MQTEDIPRRYLVSWVTKYSRIGVSRPTCQLRTSQEGTRYLLLLGIVCIGKGRCILGNSGTCCGSTGLTCKEEKNILSILQLAGIV